MRVYFYYVYLENDIVNVSKFAALIVQNDKKKKPALTSARNINDLYLMPKLKKMTYILFIWMGSYVTNRSYVISRCDVYVNFTIIHERWCRWFVCVCALLFLRHNSCFRVMGDNFSVSPLLLQHHQVLHHVRMYVSRLKRQAGWVIPFCLLHHFAWPLTH